MRVPGCASCALPTCANGPDDLDDAVAHTEQLVGEVDSGASVRREEGKTVADLQKLLTAASLKSLQSDGYAKYVADNTYKTFPNFGPAAGLQRDINVNIGEIYKNLDRL